MRKVDFHAHLLPGADHGSTSLACSLKQLSWAQSLGIDCIVTTPHFYGWKQQLNDFIHVREQSWSELKPYLNEYNLEVIPAAEVTLFRDLPEMPGLEQLTLPNTSYILLEMPMETWGNWVYTAIEKIISIRKLMPIIVHVDRYPEHEIDKLLDWNLVYQINAEAFDHFWKSRKYIRWVEEQRVHLIGSDTHGDDGTDFRKLDKALKRLTKQEEYLMKNAERVLSGKNI